MGKDVIHAKFKSMYLYHALTQRPTQAHARLYSFFMVLEAKSPALNQVLAFINTEQLASIRKVSMAGTLDPNLQIIAIGMISGIQIQTNDTSNRQQNIKTVAHLIQMRVNSFRKSSTRYGQWVQMAIYMRAVVQMVQH